MTREQSFTKGNALHETLAAINWRRGRGDIVMVYLPRFEGESHQGAVTIQKQYGRETRRFTIRPDGTVRFIGTTWKIETHDQRAARLVD